MSAKILSFPTPQIKKKSAKAGRKFKKAPFSNFVHSFPRNQTVGSLIKHAERFTAPSPGIGSLTWDEAFYVQYGMMMNNDFRAKMAEVWRASENLETPFEELMFRALDLALETEVAARLEIAEAANSR